MKRLTILTMLMVLLAVSWGCTTSTGNSGNTDSNSGLAVTDTPQNSTNASSSDGTSAQSTSGPIQDDQALITAIAALPNNASVVQIWQYLDGYWTNTDGYYMGFVLDSGNPYLVYGQWNSPSSGLADVTNAVASGSHAMTITVHYSASPATETAPAHPELDVQVSVDLSTLNSNGQIRVQVADLNSGSWCQLVYGGRTATEAQSVQ
ncbi:MAG: hypothetical protein FWC59_03595 [Actinomycetia bacterium]|nr:hypothetical protein [Actinomycetes bacterium]